MPNGGEHHERLGVCPRCGSPSIRIRRQRHRHLLWRCRSCNGVFRTPQVTEHILPPGDDGRGYVLAESIPQMERRGRLHDPRSGQHRRGRSLSRRLTIVAVTVILLGAVGYFFVMVGLDRDSGGPVQRPGSEESLVAIDSQTPSPQPAPTSADVSIPSPPATAKVAEAKVAAAIPTTTPIATRTVSPSPTPESTADETPTPSPSESAAQASTATAIPTDPPVATLTKLPTRTPTPAPIATAMPQVSPTPELTTQSADVLSGYENGGWLLHNRPGLAASIAAICLD